MFLFEQHQQQQQNQTLTENAKLNSGSCHFYLQISTDAIVYCVNMHVWLSFIRIQALHERRKSQQK